jgi:hypothetical protein
MPILFNFNCHNILHKNRYLRFLIIIIFINKDFSPQNMKQLNELNQDIKIVAKGIQEKFPDIVFANGKHGSVEGLECREGKGHPVLSVHRRSDSLVVRSRYTGSRDPAIMEILEKVASKKEIQYLSYEQGVQIASDFEIPYQI